MEQYRINNRTVSRETYDKVEKLYADFKESLETYLDQLLWWNKRINLVSRDVSRETVREHIKHSLLVSELKSFQDEELFLDTGTGGGLPGVPLAITHPEKHFVLNDLVTKKCLAIKQMAKNIGLQNIGIFDGSIEELSYDTSFCMISKHAFKINELINLTHHLPWKKILFFKGKNFKNELTGIDEELYIECHDLSPISDFYEGKAIVLLAPSSN